MEKDRIRQRRTSRDLVGTAAPLYLMALVASVGRQTRNVFGEDDASPDRAAPRNRPPIGWRGPEPGGPHLAGYDWIAGGDAALSAAAGVGSLALPAWLARIALGLPRVLRPAKQPMRPARQAIGGGHSFRPRGHPVELHQC
jgi:hypothetical protein